MARFYGEIGYAEVIQTAPGVWEEQITTRKYYGDLITNNRRYEQGEHLNDNLNVTNRISVVADPYAYQNFHKIRYVRWMGSLWKVGTVEVQRPRLILSLGGVYNGITP